MVYLPLCDYDPNAVAYDKYGNIHIICNDEVLSFYDTHGRKLVEALIKQLEVALRETETLPADF
jgi:hypothetical protein